MGIEPTVVDDDDDDECVFFDQSASGSVLGRRARCWSRVLTKIASIRLFFPIKLLKKTNSFETSFLSSFLNSPLWGSVWVFSSFFL